MSIVLIVDDSRVDQTLAGGLLSRDGDLTIQYAANGREALESIQAAAPDLVLSDLQMPEMDGLALVDAVRHDHPGLPVILMTARGSELIAVEALRRGAAGYIPKSVLADQLEETVHHVLQAVRADRAHTRVMHALARMECRFVLRNDAELIHALVGHLQETLRCIPLGSEAERLRVGRAVGQALWIAHEHGNLELPLDATLSDPARQEWLQARRGEAPWSDRNLEIQTAITPTEAVFTIDYDGPPIAANRLPSNLAEQAVDNPWLGRFVLIQAVVDDADFRQNESRIVLKIRPRLTATDDGPMELG